MEVAHLISLICGKGDHRPACNKSLHLHICRCHKRAGNAMQVNTFISLIDVVGF